MKSRCFLGKVLLVGAGLAPLLLGVGCYGAYEVTGGGAGAARLQVWPENYDTVARNAAVWVEVRPSFAQVTSFRLYEVWDDRYYETPCATSRREFSNEYLFCPDSNLSPYTRYIVELEVDYDTQYRWQFDTSGGYAGSASDCYYVEPYGGQAVSAKDAGAQPVEL